VLRTVRRTGPPVAKFTEFRPPKFVQVRVIVCVPAATLAMKLRPAQLMCPYGQIAVLTDPRC
jgi:hypothetical protein